MVFNGHVHAYLRTKNVAFGKEQKDGPVHIVVGAGGRAAQAEFVNEIPEEYVAVRDATWYGYGMVEVCNQTHIRWDWVHTGLECKCFALFVYSKKQLGSLHSRYLFCTYYNS